MADFQDWLPERMATRRGVIDAARRVFQTASYAEMAVPMLEDESLFARTSGEASEVVHKEMYTFQDRGGRRLALRPELTAGIVRAYLDHGLARRPQPVRVYSCGSAFRYNRTQRGRYREFVQFDAEAIGSADPAVDAELIALQTLWMRRLGLQGLVLELNSIDTPAARRDYVTRLRAYLDQRADELGADARRLRDTNPLRLFDAKDAATRRVLEDAPKITDQLSEPAAQHFAAVRAHLDARGIDYIVDKTLVRGLDYYAHTTWELKWPPLGTQGATLIGAGRYDGFTELLGGPPAPAVGLAAGVDRIVLAVEAQGLAEHVGQRRGVDAYFQIDAVEARPALHAVMDEARALGVVCETDLAGRSVKGQAKHAQRIGARLVVFCGPGEWARRVACLRGRDAGTAASEVALDELAPAIAAAAAA